MECAVPLEHLKTNPNDEEEYRILGENRPLKYVFDCKNIVDQVNKKTLPLSTIKFFAKRCYQRVTDISVFSNTSNRQSGFSPPFR